MQSKSQNGNLERHEVFKIEDRAQCQTCFKYQILGETFCFCGSSPQSITAEVKKQAGQRINSRFIMYKLALKNIQRGQRYGWVTEELKVRNDRGAPAGGRAVPHAHERTGIHTIRHGSISVNSE